MGVGPDGDQPGRHRIGEARPADGLAVTWKGLACLDEIGRHIDRDRDAAANQDRQADIDEVSGSVVEGDHDRVGTIWYLATGQSVEGRIEIRDTGPGRQPLHLFLEQPVR